MLLQRLHNAVVALLHVERRFEPFFRPAVDAVLREPLAALTQALINLGRRDERLGLAEETIQPDEEAHLQAIIDTLGAYMQRHWSPGNYQRGGNTKTHGVVRATSPSATICRRSSGTACSPSRRPTPPGSAFPVPGRTGRATSTTSVSSAAPSR